MSTKRFLLLMLFPAVVIFGFMSLKMFTITTGEEIVLEIPRPIDPVDLLRGNYVDLNYAISRIDFSKITAGSGDFSYGDTVFAVLARGEKFWVIEEAGKRLPILKDGQVCMKGEVKSSTLFESDSELGLQGNLDVQWGIESFFAPPETAKEIENQRRDREVTVSGIVVVDTNCNSVLRALDVDGTIIKTR